MFDPALLPFVLFFGFLLMFGAILRFAAISARKAEENMLRLAGDLGLTAQPAPRKWIFRGFPGAAGVIRGKPVKLYNFTTGSGKSRVTWAALAVTPAATGGLKFKLSRQGLGTKVMELFGTKEVQVGDPQFDREWFIQTNQPEFFAAALLPEIQQKILPLRGKWELADNVLVYVEQGTFADNHRCARFATAVGAACDLADIAEVFAGQQGGKP